MFGGLAFLCRGRMCCGIVGADLMVRVPDDEYEELLGEAHVRPMNFTGKALKGFVYVSPPGIRRSTVLRTWLSRGERVARERAAQPTARSRSRGSRSPSRARGSASRARVKK